jgi:hypothetical protein
MGQIEVSPDFVQKLSNAISEKNWSRMFTYPQTPEERQRVEDNIRREYERCKEDYNYWYKNYYVPLNSEYDSY